MRDKLKLHKTVLYRNAHAVVYVEKKDAMLGSTEYVYISKPNIHAVVVIVMNETIEKILVVSQYRQPLRRVMVQFVMGGVETGETPLQAAKRELKEEAGIIGKGWKNLGLIHAEPGLSDQITHVFLTYETNSLPGKFYEMNIPITKQYLLLSEFESMIRDSKITCGFTLSAYLKYTLRHKSYKTLSRNRV